MAVHIYEHQRGLDGFHSNQKAVIDDLLGKIKTGTRSEFRSLLHLSGESDVLERLIAKEYSRNESLIFDQILKSLGGFRQLLEVYVQRYKWSAYRQYLRRDSKTIAIQMINDKIIGEAIGESRYIAGEKVCELTLQELRQVEATSDQKSLLKCYAGFRAPPIEILSYLESKPKVRRASSKEENDQLKMS